MCILLGMGSLIWGVFIKLIPDAAFKNIKLLEHDNRPEDMLVK